MSTILEAKEKLAKMRNIVEEELKHIPRGDLNQNFLRQTFAALRMNSLGRKAQYPNSRQAVLKASIDLMKKTYPDFKPTYDKPFFSS